MANRLEYTQSDWVSLVNQLTNILKTKNSWIDAYVSSTGQTLIEFYAYVANMIMYSVERTAEECYIETAQRLSSVINLTTLLNYKPKRNVSATGNVVFTLSSSHTSNIIIPKYTSLSTVGGYKYLTSQDTIIFSGQTTATVPVIQGEYVEVSYTSAGGINQEYQLSSTKIENTNIFPKVNSVNWNIVSSFIDSINNSTDCIVKTNLDNTLTIKFGDNINGLAPSNGDAISISYIDSDGVLGNVYSAGSLTTINDTIYDTLSTQVTNISVTNQESILGGDDAEGIEEIRVNGPAVFSTGDRFVTKADGIAIVRSYASVESANVWGEAELPNPDYNSFNVAYISMILQDWTLPNTDFKNTMSEFLYTKAPLTIRFSYVDPTIINAYPVVSIYVKSGYSLSSVQNAVITALQSQFELGVTSLIGTDIRFAKVVAAIQAVDGVSYCYLTLKSQAPLIADYTSSYDWGTVLPLTPIKTSSVYLRVEGVNVAVDNGSGVFTDISSDYTVSGNVNYLTGEINANISPSVGALEAVYEQNESGDLVVGNSQILKYYDSSITTQYIA